MAKKNGFDLAEFEASIRGVSPIILAKATRLLATERARQAKEEQDILSSNKPIVLTDDDLEPVEAASVQ